VITNSALHDLALLLDTHSQGAYGPSDPGLLMLIYHIVAAKRIGMWWTPAEPLSKLKRRNLSEINLENSVWRYIRDYNEPDERKS
jgi:hypothetical protein